MNVAIWIIGYQNYNNGIYNFQFLDKEDEQIDRLRSIDFFDE